MSKRNPVAHRGFALLVVLVIVSVGLAMATALINSAPSTMTSAATKSSETIARSIAEACLERAFKEARNSINNLGAQDFDLLLDPGMSDLGDFSDADMFIPPLPGSVVYVPKNSDALGDLAAAAHRYRYRADAARGGACLIRYDDNSDDFYNPIGLSANEGPAGPNVVPEGAGLERINRDRDSSIQVTAIGIHPVLASTAPADAYALAKSHTTTRGVLRTSVTGSASTGVGVYATGEIDVNGGGGGGGSPNFAVCGTTAGAMYDTSSGSKNCTCGADTSPGTPLGQCSGVCSDTCNYSSSAAAIPPFANVLPAGPEFLPTFRTPITLNRAGLGPADDEKIWGVGVGPGTANNGDPICSFWFQRYHAFNGDGAVPFTSGAPAGTRAFNPGNGRTDAMAYLWDYDVGDDWNASTPTSNAYGANYTYVAEGTAPAPGNPFRTCNAVEPQVFGPCDWYLTNPGGGAEIHCSETQTPCWVPIAFLDNSPASNWFDQTEPTNPGGAYGEIFQPRDTDQIPVMGSTFGAKCGARATNSGGLSWDHNNGGSETWDFEGDVDANEWPTRGVYLIFNEEYVPNGAPNPAAPGDFTMPAQTDFALNTSGADVGDENDIWRVTIVSNSGVRLDDEVGICCPTCDCSNWQQLDNNCDTHVSGARTGGLPAIITSGRCDLDFSGGGDDQHIVGNIECATVQINDRLDCLVGDVIATTHCVGCGGSAGLDECTGGIGSNPGVCIHDRNNINGNILSVGDIRMNDRNNIYNTNPPNGTVVPRYIVTQERMEIDRRNYFEASTYALNLTLAGTGTAYDMDERNTFIGQLLVNGDIEVDDDRNYVIWSGLAGTTGVVTVTPSAMWYESTW